MICRRETKRALGVLVRTESCSVDRLVVEREFKEGIMSGFVRNLVALIIALAAPLVIGGLSSISTISSIPTWYRGLSKPPWNPPDWAFGPAWTALYILMGVASWLVWRYGWDNRSVRVALRVFAVQLLLNGIWSVLFFGLRSPGIALVEIGVLWCMILATVVLFARRDLLAGAILVPYLLWVTFASALNWEVWSLNR